MTCLCVLSKYKRICSFFFYFFVIINQFCKKLKSEWVLLSSENDFAISSGRLENSKALSIDLLNSVIN